MKKLRRTMLFCPANEPKLYLNSSIYNPDCIIFDLEDAIIYSEKDAARDLLCEAVKKIDFGAIEVYVRINQLSTGFGETDVRETVKAGIRNIRLPMCETKEDVEELDMLLSRIEQEAGLERGTVKIQCALETPKGVLNALEIGRASSRVTSISFGAEDYTNCLGVERTKEGRELAYARSYIPVAASVLGIDSIDTVWTDVSDMEGFIREAKEAKTLGFSGKSCIHPLQLKEVQKIYTPSPEEVEKSEKILKAAEEAEKASKGVILVDGKMVDVPVLSKARKILDLASPKKVEG